MSFNLKNWEQGIEISPATALYLLKSITESEIRETGLKTALRSKLIAFKTGDNVTADATLTVEEFNSNYFKTDLI